jgi:Xaa-Pro aminopeptidase
MMSLTYKTSATNIIHQCPIHKRLIDLELLSTGERDWLNAYHAEILDKIAPLLHNDARALEWLRRECSPL